MISHGEAQPFDFKFIFSKEMLTSFMWHQEKKKKNWKHKQQVKYLVKFEIEYWTS